MSRGFTLPPLGTFGVCHNPEPVSSVRGANGASWNNKRPDGEAFIFQLCGNGVETEANMSANILCNDPAGADFSNDAVHFGPEVARVRLALLLAGNAEGLARVSSANNVNCSGVLGTVKLADVGMDGNIGPVSGEDSLAIGFDFTEGCGCKPGSLKTEAETSDSAE
jgi:hypothetical protein